MIQGLKDKVVIITGGGHGIGKAYCLGFGKAGSQVVVADIDKRAAERVAAQITEKVWCDAVSVHVDVCNGKSTKDMTAAALRRVCRIEGLVNNADIFVTIPING